MTYWECLRKPSEYSDGMCSRTYHSWCITIITLCPYIPESQTFLDWCDMNNWTTWYHQDISPYKAVKLRYPSLEI